MAESAGLPPGRLAGRIALITGASRGIGAAVAKRFAAEGAHVILTARTTGALEEVDDAIRAAAKESGSPPPQVTLVPADLLDFDKIDQIGAAIAQRFGRLDVLVGNAGRLGILSPMSHIDPPVWDRTLALNLTANWRLIRIMEPLLKLSPAGELNKTKVNVNLVDPGAVRTRMRAEAYPGEDPMRLKPPEAVTDTFVQLASAEEARHVEIVSIF